MTASKTASKNVKAVTDGNFEQEVVQSSQLALVDFWAAWCGPCQLLGPTIEEIADEFVGQLKVCKMDVDENQSVPSQFQIRGIPTVLLFKDGKLVDQMVGNQPKATLVSAIQKHLG
jgi:thioredoxin 1